MICVSLNELTTLRWSFEEDVKRCAAAGVPALGVWRHKLSDLGLEAARASLDAHQLKVSHLAWAGGFTGDGWSFREAVDDALDALYLAGQLEAGGLLVHSGGRLGHTRNHARQLFLEALGILLPVAETFGVPLLVEPRHPGGRTDVTWLESIDDFLRLKEALADSRLKMVFDTYHLGLVPDILGRIPDIAPHVGLLQLADAPSPPAVEANRCLPGRGIIPVRAILDAFLSADYTGYVDVELFGEEMDELSYSARVAYVARLGRRLTARSSRVAPEEEGASPTT